MLGQPNTVSRSLLFAWLLCAAHPAAAQQPDPIVSATVSNVTRAESWNYFQPVVLPASTLPVGDPDYAFAGDRAELAVSVEGARFDLDGAFNYVRVENLPTNAIGPGGLGTGAFYFAASGVPYSYQLYTSGLSVRIKAADRRSSVAFGRMPFSSGSSARTSTPRAVDRVIRERLASRLVGNFEWSYYQRRFDGVRADLDRGAWNLTAAAFVPTQGGFEESTNLSMPRVQVAALEWRRPSSRSELQVFGYGYRDRRQRTAVVDNTGSPDAPVDITIGTLGASYARVSPSRSGEWDVVGWGAGQFGSWYDASHRAGSVAMEGGHRWTHAAMTPWLRAGYLYASGDGSEHDSVHGTFFPMLPSTRQYVLSSVYSSMNLRDAFAQLVLEPRRVRARIEVHKVSVASGKDLWYHGSGATASHDRYLGFSGRSAGGATALGTVLEGAIDVPVMKYWSINAYAAVMTAGDVVQRSFTPRALRFWSVENVVRLGK